MRKGEGKLGGAEEQAGVTQSMDACFMKNLTSELLKGGFCLLQPVGFIEKRMDG